VTDQVDYLLSNPFEFNEGNLVAWYRLVSIVPFFFLLFLYPQVTLRPLFALLVLVGSTTVHE
jgi:hypothetical protein